MLLRSVWIQLKTEKYCSKIILKYVNNTVKPIFNEKIAKNVICGFMNSARCALFTAKSQILLRNSE